MNTFLMDYGLLIAAGFFVAFILLLAYGLCRAAAAGDERRSALGPSRGRPALVLLSGEDDRDRELLDLFNDWPIRAATFPDGSTDELTRSLDVIADLAAAPSFPDDAA